MIALRNEDALDDGGVPNRLIFEPRLAMKSDPVPALIIK